MRIFPSAVVILSTLCLAAPFAEADPTAPDTAEAEPTEAEAKAEKPAARGGSEEAASASAETEEAETGSPGDVSIIDLQLAEKIEERQPVEPSTAFVKDATVFVWIKAAVQVAEAQLQLRWTHGDTVATSQPFTVKQSSGWRTWRSRAFPTAGEWKVEVVGPGDSVLKTATFTVN